MATRQDVNQHLAAITAPGGFATGLTAVADDFHLDVRGVGRLALPIAKATARRLCTVARPARYGFKDQTRLDHRVRSTWEIPKGRIRIDQRAWRSMIRPLLAHIGRDLGLPDGATLDLELHNMLVYEPGQFFVPHQHSEKTDDMIGTLVVLLPSAHTGGELVVEHQGETRTFRGSDRRLTFIAFYADCHHQVRPVKAGFRIALTYHLTLNGSRDEPGSHVATPRVDALVQCIEQYFATPRAPRWAHDGRREPPNRLVYLLDHQYTRRGLEWNRLKNGDIARVAALREVARRLDCEIFLALADVQESWSCEDEGYADRRFGYHRTRYWDAEEDEGGDAEAPAVVIVNSTVWAPTETCPDRCPPPLPLGRACCHSAGMRSGLCRDGRLPATTLMPNHALRCWGQAGDAGDRFASEPPAVSSSCREHRGTALRHKETRGTRPDANRKERTEVTANRTA